MRLSDENPKGRPCAADGQAIGEIAALFLDSGTWRVESLQINLRNEVADQLGAAHGLQESLSGRTRQYQAEGEGPSGMVSAAASCEPLPWHRPVPRGPRQIDSCFPARE